MSKLPKAKWSMLGCLGCSERCLAAFEYLSASKFIETVSLFAILDPPSAYSDISLTKLSLRRQAFVKLGGQADDITDYALFERVEQIVINTQRFIGESNGNVIIDVTSFPKRYFLPILRLLINSKQVKNILVTYTVPESYTREALAEDPEPWRHIPLYAPPFPEPKTEIIIVGLGFEPLGLPDLLEHDYHDVDLKLLFPFPPGPPAFQRSWEFVRRLEKSLPKHGSEPVRVPALDISSAFDHILSATDNGKRYAILAPYGPKPISVAMGIYASLSDSPIYYTQPRAYNPNYCSGIKRIGDYYETYGYCIRLRGENFYDVPKTRRQLAP